MINRIRNIFGKGKEGVVKSEKTLRTRLMYIPIALVTLAIIGVIVSVSIRTETNVKSQMERDTELLLINVEERLKDQLDLTENMSIEEEQEYFSRIIDSLTSTEEISYAGYTGKDLVGVANSDSTYVGRDMSQDEEIMDAIRRNETIAQELELYGEEVYDVIHPITVDGENAGALRIGIKMDEMNRAIQESVRNIFIIGLIIIIIIGFFLYRVSSEVIYVLESLGQDSLMMGEGDFSMDVPEEMLARRDEFGVIARANMAMKESIRGILRDVTTKAELVTAHSQEVASVTSQSELASDEMASVVQEIAGATSNQAHEVEDGFTAVRGLHDVMEINNTNIERLNVSTEEVNTLKDEGLGHIRDLVKNTDETRESIKEIGEVINNTHESAGNIAQAIDMIESISEQTNLLALNAAIEAARAGDQGRGFAVVAEEIRSLAVESKSFTAEIEDIVRDLMSKTNTAVETMDNVNNVVELQGQSVGLTDGKFQGISLSLEEIQGAIGEVNKSNEIMREQEERLASLMENLAAVAEENAAGTEEASASVEEQNAIMNEITKASQDLAGIAEELNEAVQVFKI